MMRRFVSASSWTVVAAGVTTGAASTTVGSRAFSSNYGDIGNYKPPLRVGGRSGAHRRPPKQNYPPKASTPAEPEHARNHTAEEEDPIEDVQEVEMEAEDAVPAKRNYKNHYRGLFKPKPQPISFTSSFKAEAQQGQPSHTAHDEDDDVTKIYSHEEVARIVKKDTGRENRSPPRKQDADDDVLRALDEDADEGAQVVVTRTYKAEEEDLVENDEGDHSPAEASTDGEDKFREIRAHPFYADLIKRVERNMAHYRNDIRSSGRFSADAVDECVRPLLQLADYPFTTKELAQLASCINPSALARTLADRHACGRMHVYRSPDTDLLLDWSVEDFLRRRYESVHMSWEPMDVVYRRFGWTGEELSDRDLLLYFSEFSEYVELAELEFGVNGKPRAVPIPNPVERAQKAPISASRLLIRRVPDGETEPSITEAIRLMGSPAMAEKGRKGGSQRGRHTHHRNTDSVSDMFAAVEQAAKEVDGDETTKLNHGIDTVHSLRQATHPGGRTINEFSIGKRRGEEATAPSSANRDGNTLSVGEEDTPAPVATSRRKPTKFNAEAYEKLSNAYHKTKVDIAMLRRRLLSTENTAKAESLQAKLASQRRELARLNEELRHMSALRRQHQIDIEEGKIEDDDDEDGVTTTKAGAVKYEAGFSIPRSRPQYMEAPELEEPKNEQAAANGNENDDDDVDISEELQEYEQLHQPSAKAANRYATGRTAEPTRSVEAEVEEDGEVEAAGDDVNGMGADMGGEFAHRRRLHTEAPSSRPITDLRDDFDELAAADDFDADEYVASGHISHKRSAKKPHPPRTTATSARVAEEEEEGEGSRDEVDELTGERDDAELEAEQGDDEAEPVTVPTAEAKRSASGSGRGKNAVKAPPRPQYMNAPERDVDEVLEEGAGLDAEDDDDLDITAAIEEYEAELQRPRDSAVYSSNWKAEKATRKEEPRSGSTKHVAKADTEAPAEETEAVDAADDLETNADMVEAEAEEEGESLQSVTAEGDTTDAAAMDDGPEAMVEKLREAVEAATADVNEARDALERIQEEQRTANAAFAKRIATATQELQAREAQCGALEQELNEAEEAAAREAAEAKAQAVERELEAQRQRRQAEVARQREQARMAQHEAQKALERQRRIEQEALAKERELEQQLAKVRAQLRAVEEGAALAADEEEAVDATSAQHDAHGEGEMAAEEAYHERDVEEDAAPLHADAAEEDVLAAEAETEEPMEDAAPVPAAAPVATDSPPHTSGAANTASTSGSSSFMCSPEQYDGLHLAAERLRNEISALEEQMEQAGDEDDETLMAVLAESRADLEELDECISSVQQNASWAAASDAKRAQEQRASAQTIDTEAQRIQKEIDNHRFQIGLLEKRLHHATQRSITNKLEQGIVAARREIARLRREQDRLRREGRDAFGLPASVSIAETLAGEDRTREKQRREAQAAIQAAAGNKTRGAEAGHELDRNAEEAGESDLAAEGAEVDGEEMDAEADLQAAEEAEGMVASTSAGQDPSHLEKTNADPEAHRLHLRLDSMLRDIQQLQDNIAIQERTSDYDDEETESVLREMKSKLGQLLSLRDAVQQRLASSAGGVPPVASAPSTASAPLAADHNATAPRASFRPSARDTASSTSSGLRMGATAAKKVRRMARYQRH